MASYQLIGGPWNNAVICGLLLIDASGTANSINLLRSLSGDIKFVPVKPQAVAAKVQGVTIWSGQGDQADGSLEIPLHLRALTDPTGAGTPTLTEILNQIGTGTTFVPWTTITGTDPNGNNAPLLIDPTNRCWLYQIDIAYSRGGDTSAINKNRVQIYAETTPPDETYANTGAVSSHSLSGVVRRIYQRSLSNV